MAIDSLRRLRQTFPLLPILLAGCGGAEALQPEPNESRIEKIQIPVGEFVFDALAAGPAEGPLVLLLHGFPQTGYSYRHQLSELGKAGYRAVAPNQRGYSPGARPPEVADYALSLIVPDAMGMVDALGRQRFHLVGHDWGGAVAWILATRFPERVISLTVFSTPHVSAFGAELAKPDSDQARRSSYFSVFGAEGAEERFLAEDAAVLRGVFQTAGSPQATSTPGLTAEDIQHYVDALSDPAAMKAALNWYRASNLSRTTTAAGGSPPPLPRIRVPTLYVWGNQDPAFGRAAAEATREFVAGPYRFEVLDGIGHWIPEQAAGSVTPMLLDHIRQNPE